MTRRCVIKGCDSKSGIEEHKGVTFHSFPFDSKTREVWIVNCRLPPDKNITKTVLVCSRHFRRVDFQPVKTNKFMLKQGAVPTIFPWGKTGVTETLDPDRASNSTIVASTSYTKEDAMKSIEQSSDTAVPSTSSGTTKTTKAADSNKAKTLKRSITDSGNSSSSSSSKQDVRPAKVAKLSKEKKSHAKQNSSSSSGSKAESRSSMNPPSPSVVRKVDQILAFVPGARIEAQDFDGVWHAARVIEVDHDEREVLIRFEKSAKNKNSVEEWIQMNSSRLRQKEFLMSTKPQPSFTVGEKVMARWSGPRRFPATINKVLGNDMYEVLFDDGYVKVMRASHIIKPKQKDKSESKIASGNKSKDSSKKWPLISMSSLNLEELNLPVIPNDGEWCCHWVNDQPIGKEGFLTVGDHSKPTVVVDDWRLPAGWIKHMYQRSNVLGKWDVILVNPQGKRFRSKADLKQYLEELGQVYNPDIYDFSIHRRRAKDIGAYVHTKDYKPPNTQAQETKITTPPATSTVSSPTPLSTSSMIPTSPSPVPPAELLSTPTAASTASTSATVSASVSELPTIEALEDGFVYVGSLKVQIIDNLFRCPQEGCNKNFRKENHLQIHIKHYHTEIAKLLGVCPNMQDLACKRTIGTPHEEPLPKNHLPNAQFFAKLHQQDIQAKAHRKSTSTPATPTMCSPPQSTSSHGVDTTPPEDTGVAKKGVQEKIDVSATEDLSLSSELLSTPITVKDPSVNKDPVPSQEKSKSKLSSHTKGSSSKGKKSTVTGSRKSSRQRLTKKYLSANSAGILTANLSTAATDLEETRHSFNTTPEISGKTVPNTVVVATTSTSKKKSSQQISNVVFTTVTGDSNQDANSHTTGSIPETSQSPQYINENGEIIKIVRMKQEEIINCLCSFAEEDGLMIQCELCLCWQHGICNGIEKESQVPEKYICYICRNPQRGRASAKYIHDQDWLYEGKLPVANYHAAPPGLEERFDLLKKSHTFTGNLLEIKRFLHSLKVKINIAENKDHPKMYLWAKKWESSPIKEYKSDPDSKENVLCDVEMNDDLNRTKKNNIDEIKLEGGDDKSQIANTTQNSFIKNEIKDELQNQPTIPQPEAPIDSVECQHRLLEHIQKMQSCVMERLQNIESEIIELESVHNCGDMSTSDATAKETLSMLIQDLEIMRNIGKINTASPNFVAY